MINEEEILDLLSYAIHTSTKNAGAFDIVYKHIKTKYPDAAEYDVCREIYILAQKIVANNLQESLELSRTNKRLKKQIAVWKAIEKNEGNKTAAAEDLEISVRTLHRILEK